jgi:hypothetical protein
MVASAFNLPLPGRNALLVSGKSSMQTVWMSWKILSSKKSNEIEALKSQLDEQHNMIAALDEKPPEGLRRF